MKVLMTADCVGGVFSYAIDLADALHALGVEIVLAVMGAPLDGDRAALLQARPWLRVEARPFRMVWMDDAWHDVDRAGHWLLRLRDRHRPDVIHCNDHGHVNLPWHQPVLLVLHSCVATWFEAVRGTPPPPTYDAYRRVVRRAAADADLVVAPTHAMLQQFERCHGPLARTRVIENGIAPRSDPSRSPARDEKQPFVLSVGRVWDEAKNLTTLASASWHLDWPVLVAGATRFDADGDGGPPELPGIRLLGEVPRRSVLDLLDRAAIYAHPACYEPFGLAPVEAAAADAALVLADIPSLREIWGDDAVFCTPDDPVAWTRALQQLIRAPGRRRELADRARRRASHFTAERMARAYADAYAQLQRNPVPV